MYSDRTVTNVLLKLQLESPLRYIQKHARLAAWREAAQTSNISLEGIWTITVLRGSYVQERAHWKSVVLVIRVFLKAQSVAGWRTDGSANRRDVSLTSSLREMLCSASVSVFKDSEWLIRDFTEREQNITKLSLKSCCSTALGASDWLVSVPGGLQCRNFIVQEAKTEFRRRNFCFFVFRETEEVTATGKL